MYEIGVARTFEALHQLEGDVESAGHQHEHGYRVEAVVRGRALADGMLLDLDILGEVLSECLAELDASDLDALPFFASGTTTVEMVAGHIWEHVRSQLDTHAGLESLRVSVFESADAWASIDQPLAG